MTKMTSKGQVTIPKRLRDHLALKPGAYVNFELAANGEIVLRTKEKRRTGPFDVLLGSAQSGMWH
jgi:antitoxin PrlF